MAARERERLSRAKNECQSQPQPSAPLFGVPVRVQEASDHLSHSVQQTLGPFPIVNPSQLSSLIGIPKQPQTPAEPFPGQDVFKMNPTSVESSVQLNGNYQAATGHSKRKSNHSKQGSIAKPGNPPSKSGNAQEKKKTSKSQSSKSGSKGSKGSSSQRSRPPSSSDAPKSDNNHTDSKKARNKHNKLDKCSNKAAAADMPSLQSMPPILSPIEADTLLSKPQNNSRLKVDLNHHHHRHHQEEEEEEETETNGPSIGSDGDTDAITEDDLSNATRLATHQGNTTRPISRTEPSKDKEVQDILRIYTEHYNLPPLSANINTPIDESTPKFPFIQEIDQVSEIPTIEEEGEEEEEENDDDEDEDENDDEEEEEEEEEENKLSDDLQISESEKEEDNSHNNKTTGAEEDTTQTTESAMVKVSEEGSGESSSSEDEETPSSSDSEESESEESSKGGQTRDPSPRPKEKSFSLLSQFMKVQKEQKFTPRSGPFSENLDSSINKSSSTGLLPKFNRLDNTKRNPSSPDTEHHHDDTPQIEDRTENHDADDEEDEIEQARNSAKETKSKNVVSSTPNKGKTVTKSSRSSELKKAPGVKPSSKGGSGSQEKVAASQGKVPPAASKSTKSFSAGKKVRETKTKNKTEKNDIEEVASSNSSKKIRVTSGKSSSTRPSNSKLKPRRKSSKKEEKFPSKPYITSSDSEEEDVRTNSNTVHPTPQEHVDHKTEKSTEHRTSRGKSPQVHGVRKEPKGPPLLSKIREKSTQQQQRRRVPHKSMDSSEDEQPQTVLSPVSVTHEEKVEVVPPPPRDTGLFLPKGDIPHLVVSFDLALIRQLPIKEEKKPDSLLFGPPKRKDPLDTEKPSAIVKPYHTVRGRESSTDSRKEKNGRTEQRRSRTESSSRSPRRIREPPLLVAEQPPDIDRPPILPSDPSRTLDRRRSANQHEDLSNMEGPHRRVDLGEHEPPPPKRPRTDRLDSRENGRQQVENWNCTEPNHEESPEGIFTGEEGAIHRGGTWESEGFHRQGYCRGTDCNRRHSFEERQQYTSDDYLAEGKRLKHLADSQTDKYTQSLTYFEAALQFIMCGNNFERDPGYTDEKAIRMYSDTCKIIKWLIGIHSGSEGRSNDKKLAVLCYRFQALLNMRMYKLKRHATTKLSKVLNDHYKSSKSSQQNQSWNPSSKYSETPSPMSPTPSPAGSVGSVGSMGSQGSNSSDIPPATTSSKMGPGMNMSTGGTTVPQRIYNMMSTYMTNSTYCLTSIDYWEQAETLSQENQDFFQEVQEHCRVLLTLHSSILDLVRYSKYCLLKLKGLRVLEVQT